MTRVLAIPGSLRTHSFNRALLEAAARTAPPPLAIELYDELGELPLFNEDREANPPPAVLALRERVRSADGLLISTPEYNRSIPGVLKNAIDWLSRAAPDEPLAGKPVAILGATPGPWGTRLSQSHLREVLAATETRLLPAPAFYLARATVPLEPRVLDRLGALLAAFAAWIEVTAAVR